MPAAVADQDGAEGTTAEPPSAKRSRPPIWFEGSAAFELAELIACPVYYGIGVPRGDGTPVLLTPGFLGSDDYLIVLHGWLRRIGYRPYSSGLVCIGPIESLAAQLVRRAERIAEATNRPLILIGHSLGGMLSCGVALRRPDLVSQVVTLGSARTPGAREASDPLVRALAEILLPSRSAAAKALEQELLGAPVPDGVRLSCIYSRDDAVVDWRACLDEDPRTTTHEVRGSHTGLAWNARVYRLLARLLASG